MKSELLAYLALQGVPAPIASELIDGAEEMLELVADALHTAAERNRAQLILAYVEAGTRLIQAEVGDRLGPNLIAVAQKLYDDAKKAAESEGDSLTGHEDDGASPHVPE